MRYEKLHNITLTDRWLATDLNSKWFEQDTSKGVELQYLTRGFTKNGELLKYRCPICGKLFKESVASCSRCKIKYRMERVS